MLVSGVLCVLVRLVPLTQVAYVADVRMPPDSDGKTYVPNEAVRQVHTQTRLSSSAPQCRATR